MATQKFNTSQQRVIDQDNRNMALATSGVDPMSKVLNDMQSQIDSGNIGMTADAPDVDSIAKGGGAFGYDTATTVGLNFGYRAGKVLVGQTIKSIAAGTILLAASQTNYVEVDGTGAGTIVTNTAGFTVGNVPLYIVVTGVSSVSTVTSNKVLLVSPTGGVIVGAMLSTAAATKSISKSPADITATTVMTVQVPPNAGKLASASYASKTTLAADDTNYFTFGLVNKTNANTAMLDTGNVNTTKATGGSGITAYTAKALTLHATVGNRNVAAGDVLELTITRTGAPATQQQVEIRLDFSFTA